ncbi:MAG TPA: hypothetical protein VD962_02275 [Rubricoccaceae bacterium]|nr:hypothetical protein [Rubricoccaceae bacterium]
MARKIRKDATLETVAKKSGIPEESFRNPDGRKTRKDKQVGTIRKEAERRGKGK